MELPQELVAAVVGQLGQLEGPAMVIGSSPLAAALTERHPGLPVVSLDPWSRRSHASRTLAAEPEALPIAPRALTAICAIEALSHYPSPEAVLSSWRQALRPHGSILIVERLIHSATMRALRRLLSAPRYQAPPEQLTALLLNAGFVSVAQRWPGSRARLVITSGLRASFE